MADIESIHQARARLEEASLLTSETIRAFHALLDEAQAGGDLLTSPPWLFVLSRQVQAWQEASDAFVLAVHERFGGQS